MNRLRAFLAVLLVATGCSHTHKQTREPGERIVRRIEKSQGAAKWYSRKAVQYDFTLDMEGQRLVDATVTMTPDLSKSRMVYADKTVAVADGENFWVVPAKNKTERMQFDMRTWPYFLALPFRLRTTGTNVASTGEIRFTGQPYESAEVSFDPGTRLEDEFFILYIDRDSHHVSIAAYTVSEKKNYADEEMTHAVVFDEFETTGGVTLPRRWYFYRWSSLHGIVGPVLGEARVSNLKFVDPDKDAFTQPREKSLPGTRPVDSISR